ncbi:hypothetical protein Ancab_015153 [Ancistrocladus abbreviatus]
MGMQNQAARMARLRQGYVKLINSGDNGMKARPRGQWMKKMKRRIRGVKLFRRRKVNWKVFSSLMLSRRTGRTYAEIVKRLISLEPVWPNVIFATNWGLPVVSASSTVHRPKTAVISYHGNLIFV